MLSTHAARHSYSPPPKMATWTPHVPVHTMVRLIGAIVPRLHTICTGGADDEERILHFIRSTTMVGLLPVPHPILIRRSQRTQSTDAWLSTFAWGVIYLRHPLLFGRIAAPKLFAVRSRNSGTHHQQQTGSANAANGGQSQQKRQEA